MPDQPTIDRLVAEQNRRWNEQRKLASALHLPPDASIVDIALTYLRRADGRTYDRSHHRQGHRQP